MIGAVRFALQPLLLDSINSSMVLLVHTIHFYNLDRYFYNVNPKNNNQDRVPRIFSTKKALHHVEWSA